MHCRAIEEMLKQVERETHEKLRRTAIPKLQKSTGYSFEEICDLLNIPEEERSQYEDCRLAEDADTAEMEKSDAEERNICTGDSSHTGTGKTD